MVQGRPPDANVCIAENDLQHGQSSAVIEEFCSKSSILLSAKDSTTGSDVLRLQIEIEDNGPGFPPEALREANQNWHTIEALAAGGGLMTS
jgi:hypothetical protein